MDYSPLYKGTMHRVPKISAVHACSTNSFGAGQYDFWLVKTEPIATPTATPTTEPFPKALIAAASGVSIAAVAACLLYYRKKRNIKSQKASGTLFLPCHVSGRLG